MTYGYYRLHIPTGIQHRIRLEWKSRLDFLETLARWNREGSFSGWQYWEDHNPWKYTAEELW